jgi:protein SCO1
MPRPLRVGVLAALVLAAAIVVAGCGGSGSSSAADDGAAGLVGTPADPIGPAPPLSLQNYLGQPIDLSDYRGQAAFVTFVYVNCPDVCPLIVSNMRAAQKELGPQAEDVEFIAVSVDPENDTPKAVKEFLEARQMVGRMEYLVGSRPELERVWHQWNIVSKTNPKRKIPDFVEHSALVYGVSANGDLTTLYPADFKPQWIVHDAPILASQ